jgi:PAS domain S-box-containing protein
MLAELQRLALVARNTSNAVIISDATGVATWVNAGFERITGYTAAEVIGIKLGALLQCEGSDRGTIERMRTALDAGLGFRCELLNRSKSGREYWLDIEIQPLRDGAGTLTGFMAIESDITSRLALTDEIERRAAMLRNAMDALDEAFVLYDAQDRLVHCNQKYRDLFRVPGVLIVPGVRFEDILRQCAQAGQFPDAIGRVDDWVADCMYKHRNGDVTRIQKVSDGRVLRIIDRRMTDGHTVGFRVDLTDMARAKEAAEQAQRMQTDFIATMSHELRTPLQSITGFSDLGKHFARDMPQFCAMFTDIHAGGMRMLKLVNGLLDVFKVDASAGTMDLRPTDLAALTAEVARELMPLMSQRDLSLMLPQPLPCLTIIADPFRMQQVIRNVLANAIRFAPVGTAIDIDCAALDSTWVELQVRDHGPGIPHDELELIFDAFAQSSRTRDGSGGTGLGLTISRKIMQAHAGSLTAENGEGGGALFRIRVPAASPQATVEPLAVASAATAPAAVPGEALEPA